MNSIWIGFDPREGAAFAVAADSIRRYSTGPVVVRGVVLSWLQRQGLYTRPTSRKINAEGHVELVDQLSIRPEYDGRIATEHAIARFLTPHLAQAINMTGWALFMDGDILPRANIVRIFDGLDSSKALYCVQHDHAPVGSVKMDGQVQTKYDRKNWSSVMAFNVDHPANAGLTLELINSAPGRELHRFCWLEDHHIGALDPKWNFLVGHSDPDIDPAAVHFTTGVPDMPGYENVPYADEWRQARESWALLGMMGAT